MLHLDARVDIDEVGPVLRVDEELERADVAVAEPHGRVDREARDLLPERLPDGRRRRLFDHLLIAPLDRALALAKADAPP